MFKSTLSRLIGPAVIGLLSTTACLFATPAAQGAPIEFANFHLLNSNQPVSFTNNGGISATLQALSVPVVFNYTMQSGLPTADRSAILTINPTPTTIPAIVAGSLIDQPIHPTSFSIIEVGTGKNLLTMSSTNGELVGLSTALNASVSGTAAGVYTSNFATFAPSASESFNLGLATLSTPLTVGAGGFLSSFNSNIIGQFSVDSTGFTPNVPEPSTIAIFATGLVLFPLLRRRGRRRQ